MRRQGAVPLERRLVHPDEAYLVPGEDVRDGDASLDCLEVHKRTVFCHSSSFQKGLRLTIRVEGETDRGTMLPSTVCHAVLAVHGVRSNVLIRSFNDFPLHLEKEKYFMTETTLIDRKSV